MLRNLLEARGVRGAAALGFGDALPFVRMPRLLEGAPASSLLVLTVPYRAGIPTGNLAAFAAAPDYHAYFAALFAATADALTAAYPGCAQRGFADHSPYAEVALAAAAGLGVRGDNSLLLTPEYGSFVVIGELLTSLPPEALAAEGFPAVTPHAIPACEHCGRCAVACPGDCLPGDDRSHCVSALSQRKAPLTPAEAAAVRRSGFVWGCDRCQIACPHNESAKPCPEGYFTENVLPGMTREALDAMSEKDFSARAFGWRPRRVLERNLEEAPHD